MPAAAFVGGRPRRSRFAVAGDGSRQAAPCRSGGRAPRTPAYVHHARGRPVGCLAAPAGSGVIGLMGSSRYRTIGVVPRTPYRRPSFLDRTGGPDEGPPVTGRRFL